MLVNRCRGEARGQKGKANLRNFPVWPKGWSARVKHDELFSEQLTLKGISLQEVKDLMIRMRIMTRTQENEE